MFQIPSLQVNQLAMSYFTNRKPFRGRVGINTQFCLQSTKAKMRTSHPCENYADAVQWWQMCPESKAQKKPHVTMAALSLHIIREKMTFYAETWKPGNLYEVLQEQLYDVTVGKHFINKIKICTDCIKYLTIIKQRHLLETYIQEWKMTFGSWYQTEQKYLTSLSPISC